MASCMVPLLKKSQYDSEEVMPRSKRNGTWHILLALEFGIIFVAACVELWRAYSTKSCSWRYRTLTFVCVALASAFRMVHFSAYASTLEGGPVLPYWFFFDVVNFFAFFLDFLTKNLVALFYFDLSNGLTTVEGNIKNRRGRLMRVVLFSFLISVCLALIALRIKLLIQQKSRADLDFNEVCWVRAGAVFIAAAGYVVIGTFYSVSLAHLRFRPGYRRTVLGRVMGVFVIVVATFIVRGVVTILDTIKAVDQPDGLDTFLVFTFVDLVPLSLVVFVISGIMRTTTFAKTAPRSSSATTWIRSSGTSDPILDSEFDSATEASGPAAHGAPPTDETVLM